MTFISVGQRPGRTLSFGRYSCASVDLPLVHPVRRRRMRSTSVPVEVR